MDRTILLALLGVPILIIIHIALFGQPIPWGGEVFSAASQDAERLQLRGHWQTPEQTIASYFVIKHAAAQGS